MATNYTTKYDKQIAERFKLASVTDSAAGKGFDFVGAKTVRVYSVDTVPEVDFDRNAGSNRFGSVINLGDTIQEMTMTQDKAFTFAIDAGDNSDQAIDNNAGKALRRQLDERTIPNMDVYRIKRWCEQANILLSLSNAPTKNTIVEAIIDTNAAMTEAKVPLDGRTLFIPTSMYKLLKQNPDFISVKDLGKKALTKGEVGEVDGCTVKTMPTSYFPAGVYFLIKYKGCTADPVKLQHYDVLPKVQGFDGPVVQGRTYYDSFVIGAKGDGVAVCGSSAFILAAPVMSISSHAVSITAVSGVTFKYTTDGSNPRYSPTAKTYSSSVTLTEGQTMRAIGTKDGFAGIEAQQAYE